nr:hypothetical protein [Oscillospiraceae bacterium]
MGKNDFDIDFDFEKEYGFDPKAFLGTEEYDDDIDLSEFTDEELGLAAASEEPAEEPAADSFDAEDDLNMDDFLNIGSQEAPQEDDAEKAYEEEAVEEPAEEDEAYPEEDDADFPDVMVFPKSKAFDEVPSPAAEEYAEAYSEEEVLDPAVFQEESYEAEDAPAYEEQEPFYEEEEDSEPEEERPRKEFKLPKINMPKITTPKIFIKFYDLYFAPILNKELLEEPRDPNNPRRRRRKSKIQIFKEVYLPPIIACVCLILVLSFAIGSLSNAIDARRASNEAKDKEQLAASQAADRLEQEYESIMSESARLASSYDFKTAVELIDTFSGDITQYPDMQSRRAEYVTAQTQLYEHRDPSLIPNLSFHVLIEDLPRAIANEELGGKYNRNFVSTGEFKQILQHLYDNGYVLVDFDSFIREATDTAGNKQYITDPIYLPADKKPVMITETMVNYFMYMVDPDKDLVPDAKGAGFANKLVVQNGEIKAEYVDASGNSHTGDYDLVPILESFIKEHPDFSYRGARATLAVTGYEGIFGYRTNTSYIATKGNAWYEEECNAARTVVQALRDKGYTLACFTYGNENYSGMSATQIQADLQEWTKNITPVIGEVDTLVFAQEGNLSSYTSSAFDVLYDTGFRYFIASGSQPWASVETTYVRQNRLMVTGRTMQWFRDQFNGMFDCAAILDVNVRGDVPN